MKHTNKKRAEVKLLYFIAFVLTIVFSFQIISIVKLLQEKDELEFNYIARDVKAVAYNYEMSAQHKIPPVNYAAVQNKKQTFVLYQIPNVDSNFKAYMDYRTITDKSSKQYELQQIATTDENGLRKYNDYYLVAMGTFYSDTVGEKFKITLENNNTFNVMIGDIKKDCDTDEKNQYAPVHEESGEFIGGNIVEFIVDDEVLDSSVKKLGTVSHYDEFDGNVVKIEQIL